MTTRHGICTITVNPGVKTKHKFEKDVHLTRAALKISKGSKRKTPTRVSLSFSSGTNQTGCPFLTLTPLKKEDSTLDLTLPKGEVITFLATGNHPVFLIGNIVDKSRKRKVCDDSSSESASSSDFSSNESKKRKVYDDSSSDFSSDENVAAEEARKTKAKKALAAGVKPQRFHYSSSDSSSDEYVAAEEARKTKAKKALAAGVKPQSFHGQEAVKGKGEPKEDTQGVEF